MKLKLDLHDIYNRGDEIDRALRAIIDEAVAKKAPDLAEAERAITHRTGRAVTHAPV